MSEEINSYSLGRKIIAWGVHAFTASAACIAILTLIYIYNHNFTGALWFMGVAIVIDAIDGSLARLVRVKLVIPNFDGSLLDNIVDYLNYVITPCSFLLAVPGMLPNGFSLLTIFTIVITSAYQFCQTDAKTPDHFFKGFPCYWNFAVFYLFICGTSSYTNVVILFILSILIFVPIKYVYPSRLDYLTKSLFLKICMHLGSIVYGLSSFMILWQYPEKKIIWIFLSFSYIIIYLVLSFYKTLTSSLQTKKLDKRA